MITNTALFWSCLFFAVACSGPADPVSRNDGRGETTVIEPAPSVRFAPPRLQDKPRDVTGFILNICGSAKPELAVPRNHAAYPCHELIRLTPYHLESGRLYQVPATLNWSSDEPAWVSVSGFDWIPDRTSVSVAGSRDVFDAPSIDPADHGEPRATVRACAKNDCPFQPNDQTCQPVVCADISVAGVVNLEGEWCLTGANLGASCTKVEILQDGRELYVLPWNAGGSVQDSTVTVKDDTTLYVGTVSQDRKTIMGAATDLMNGDSLGAWKAER